VASLQLVILDEPTVRWEPALVAGNDPSVLGEDEFFGYGVDAGTGTGTGTLADVTAVRALADWDYEQVEDVYIPAQIPDWPVPGAAGAVTDESSGASRDPDKYELSMTVIDLPPARRREFCAVDSLGK
jgi:Protein of unknown function (DUF4241)